jgi:putative oxidoreductase
MKPGKLLARVVVGGLFIAHGTQKLFGWFDGPGIEGTSKMMGSIGLRPGRRNALAASATESIGGAMLVAGALTPLAAAALIASMVTAIRTVHLKNGLWNSKGGYEFNLALIAAVAALALTGPGSISIDQALGIHLPEPVTLIVGTIALIVGVTVTLVTRSPQAQPQAETRPQTT